MWGVGTWKEGRSQLGNVPVVAKGIARLTFDTYQFRGTEIYSKETFDLENGVEFSACAKLNGLPNGLVCSLFTYDSDPATGGTDEIDVEILTNDVNANRSGSLVWGTYVWYSNWNDWHQSEPAYEDGVHNWTFQPYRYGLNVDHWHVYTIRWLPGRTDWLIDGNVVASCSKAHPNAPMPVRLNFWAATSGWPAAYDARLAPVSKPASNVRYFYDVDWVDVRRVS